MHCYGKGTSDTLKVWTLECPIRTLANMSSLCLTTKHTNIVIVHAVEAVELVAVEADNGYAFLPTGAAEFKACIATTTVLVKTGIASVADAFLTKLV